MIYTFTPNPALDLGGLADSILPNEKNYVHDETRFPGGNAINAARMMQKLGHPVVASGFFGGSVGREIETLLKKENVKTKFFKVAGETRINVTVSDLKTHLQTRLSFPGPTLSKSEIESAFSYFKKISSSNLVVIGGSLPGGFDSSHLLKLIRILNQKEIACVLDSPAPVLKKVIPSSKLLLIKPNLTEFQELVGKEVTNIGDVVKASQKLTKNVAFVCVSSVDGGAVLVTKKHAWFGKSPKVKVKTTVGAGDSMVGAMSAELHSTQNQTGEDLLRWGLAAATATLTTHGTLLGEAKQVHAFYKKVRIISVWDSP